MVGEELEAESEERSLAGRTGVYDTTIRNPNGQVIALFRGKSYRIAGEVITGLQAEDKRPRTAPPSSRIEGNPQ